MGFTREDGIYCYGNAYLIEKELPSKGFVTFSFHNGLLKGKYVLDLWIEPKEGEAYDSIYSLMTITVDTVPYKERGILSMENHWDFQSEV